MLRLVLLVCAVLPISGLFPTAPVFAQENASSSQNVAAWTMIDSSNDPTERHENGFIAYNGKLYLLGGRGVKPVQIYNPATNSWSNGASPPFQMHHFQAVVFNDLIYVVGAYTGACCDSEFGISNVWTYNPQTDQWNEGHEIPQNRRRGSTGAVVYNDKIYIAGGLDGGHGSPATAYNWFDEYDPVSGQWKILPNAPRKRDHFHAVLHNGKLFLTGGRDSSDPSITRETVAEVDVYNFNTSSWSTLAASKNLPTPRGGAASVLYQGEILVIGGETFDQDLAHKKTEALDPITETWRTLPDLIVGRHGTQASELSGALYIAAGSAQKGGEPELNSSEKFEDGSVQLVSITHSLSPGWNLAGLPLSPTSTSNYSTLYDDIDLEAGQAPLAWSESNGYQESSNLTFGAAFWIKIEDNAPPSQKQTITGVAVNAMQVQLFEGWNMVSGPSCDDVVLLGSSTSPAGAIPESAMYLFDEGYQPAYSNIFQRGRLDQGVGYWIYASNAAILTMDCGSGKTAGTTPSAIASVERRLGVILASDASGASRQLLFGRSAEAERHTDAFNLPPRIAGPYFDARFHTNQRVMLEDEGYILLQARTYPMTLSLTRLPAEKNGALSVVEMNDAGVLRSHEIAAGESVTIHDEGTLYARIRFIEGDETQTPDSFVLHGNYPNPFNPNTRIAFDLPTAADVTIRVYDLTGREIYARTISSLPAGPNHSVSIDAGAWSAGSYLYRVTAQTASETTTEAGVMVLAK